jgi:signal transduction histidine kinase/ActR/RegA family two-component response regulator
MRIRSRLLVLVLAVLVPACIAAALGIGYVYIDAQRSNRQSMRETTRALALVLDKEISRREAILHTLAGSPKLDEGDLSTFYLHARRLVPNPDTAIILSDPAGQLLLNTRLPFGTKGMPTVDAIRELRNRYGPDATVVSNLYFAPVGKDYSFSVQIPVKREGRILYYIEMGTFASYLQSVFEDQRLPAEWTGTIVDRNGVVVARSKEPEKYVGKQASGAIARKLTANREGLNEGTSLSGEPVVAFFNRAPNSEWNFIVSVPQSELRRSAVHAVALIGGTSLLLLGLAVLGALAVARKTVRPIEALRLSAERLGRGETVTTEHCGILEMDAVRTEMVRASDEIHRAKAELQLRVEEAVEVAERSQRALLQGQKLEALGRLTGGIAHDFNNVLQTLTTGLQLVQLSADNPRSRSALDACQRAVQRAGELTGQLMAFGRVQDARLETIDLKQQIAAMTPLLKGGLRGDIDFRQDIAADLWAVTLDPLQFELALLNLTINARDAMPHGGVLQLEAHNETVTQPRDELKAGDYVRLAIVDSGGGMSQEVLAKALDPFFTTKGVGKGSGLGLPQAYGFARQSGGTLMLCSTPGEGTAAIIYLPKVDHPAHAPKPDKRARQPAAAEGLILLVEDDPLVRDVVRPALEASGFRVTLAQDGEEALALLDAGQRFDLVFSDIVMPGQVSGIDLAEIVQKRFPRIRMLLATGYSERRVSLPGIRTLAKPYDVAEVVDAVSAELGASGMSAGQV